MIDQLSCKDKSKLPPLNHAAFLRKLVVILMWTIHFIFALILLIIILYIVISYIVFIISYIIILHIILYIILLYSTLL